MNKYFIFPVMSQFSTPSICLQSKVSYSNLFTDTGKPGNTFPKACVLYDTARLSTYTMPYNIVEVYPNDTCKLLYCI